MRSSYIFIIVFFRFIGHVILTYFSPLFRSLLLIVISSQEDFRFHHAEPNYLMLVRWLPKTKQVIPASATHRVHIAAFVRNRKGEVFSCSLSFYTMADFSI